MVVNTKDGNSINDLIENKSFEITSNFAAPRSVQLNLLMPVGSTPNNIPINGTVNYLVLNNDQVKAFLPYYGELQNGLAFNSKETGIKFSGTPEDYSLTYNENKKFHKVKFKIKEGREVYNVTVSLYNNLTSRIHVFSSHRSSITYTGVVKEISD
tara:strand:+ start:49832 stop:50296 length:465 start_codon:yes stop_codon:yes gene_type:complete